MSQTIAQEEIESGIAFARRAIELHESRSAPWAKVILALADERDASLAEAQRLRDELARRDAVRLEVPELTYEAFAEIMDSTESLIGIRPRETVRRERITAWFRARLVPAPPQADAVVVPAEEWKHIATLILHLVADEDVFEKIEDLMDPIGKSREARHGKAWIGTLMEEAGITQEPEIDDFFVCPPDALRTSAQDHNGEGASAKNGRKASEEELAAFEEWLHRARPSGDVEQVQRAWEESSEYADLHAHGQRGGG